MKTALNQLKEKIETDLMFIENSESELEKGCRMGYKMILTAIEELLPTEREQKKNDFIAGMEFIPVDPNKYQEDAEQYFKETYNE